MLKTLRLLLNKEIADLHIYLNVKLSTYIYRRLIQIIYTVEQIRVFVVHIKNKWAANCPGKINIHLTSLKKIRKEVLK